MTMTTREAFERGTDAFNADDIDGFAEVLADDVVFVAPGGMRREGKSACVEFYGGWHSTFPDAHVEVHSVHFVDDVAVEEAPSAVPTTGCSTPRAVTSRPPVARSACPTSMCCASAAACTPRST